MHRYSWYLAGIVWACWATAAWFYVDATVFWQGWPIAPTMLVGSFIAGSTSAGGGAVAFPVMTLLFGVDPPVARDFSLMIQSVGMGAASVGIVWMSIRIEWKSILISNLGGLPGLLIGLQVSASWPPAFTKMFFVSLWLSIALALYLINRSGREVLGRIHGYDWRKVLVLAAVGFCGGIVSGMTGSGLDILTFAVLTMLYRLDETVATPTSVVIMAINSLVGVMVCTASERISPQALTYWWCAVPVVVIGAPVGAWYIKNKSRATITRFLYASILIQFVGAMVIVPQTIGTLALSLGVLAIGCSAFACMHRFSRIDSDSLENEHDEQS